MAAPTLPPPLPTRPSPLVYPPLEDLSLHDHEEQEPRQPIASTSTSTSPPPPSLPPLPPQASSSKPTHPGLKLKEEALKGPVTYRRYRGEEDIPLIISLVETELSEPYNWYTYRYFLQDWAHLCFFAYMGDTPIGTIVCKQELHKKGLERGYIAMLAVLKTCRGKGVATKLVQLSITEMVASLAQEVVLETEFDNLAALAFYDKLGFLRDKRLFRFYLNAKDAFRLKLSLGGREMRDEEREDRAASARWGVDEELRENLEVWRRWKEGEGEEEGAGEKGEGEGDRSEKGSEKNEGLVQERSSPRTRSEAAGT